MEDNQPKYKTVKIPDLPSIYANNRKEIEMEAGLKRISRMRKEMRDVQFKVEHLYKELKELKGKVKDIEYNVYK